MSQGTNGVHDAEGKTLQGHQWYLQAGEAGAEDKRFLEEFGNIVRWNGSFGVRLAPHRTGRHMLV